MRGMFLLDLQSTGRPRIGGEVIILFWLRPDEIVVVRESCKMPVFFEKSPLSGAEKHPYFQVTSCHHFVTTIVDFAYIESE